jgi:hypothetical protein
MSTFKFTDPESGKIFEIQGPAGFTQDQANAVFQQQVDSGALVGFRSGDILNAEVQSVSGVSAANSQVLQAAAKIAGSTQGALGGAYNNITSSASVLSNGMRGANGVAQSVEARTVAGIANSLASTVVTDGITVSNFAKQASALVPIKNLGIPELTGVLSQASRLVGQSASALSNLGAGKFGLDCNQLELAGFIKPGTAAKYLSSGVNQLQDILSSPIVWTGKDGIANVDNLLKSIPSQDKIQQTLMNTGLSTVAQLGIPVDKLNPQALAGVALNAAKSAKDALAWATDKLPTDLKSAYDAVAKNAAYAVDFAKSKVSDAMKGLSLPLPSLDTVNRSTLDAAAKRIIGNAKIPGISYTSAIGDSISGVLDAAKSKVTAAVDYAKTQGTAAVNYVKSQV